MPLDAQQVYALLRKEVSKALVGRPSHEHVAEIAVLPTPLSVEEGTLTRTMKPRRAQVCERYATELQALLHSLR